MLLEFKSKSMSLPGVAIMTSGLLRRATSCFWMELAPITKAASSLTYLFNFSNS